MRSPSFGSRISATMVLLLVNVAAFLFECAWYGYGQGGLRLPHGDYLALSCDGLRQGYIWQLITFQFLHGGLLHLLVNCWVIYAFGRELEATLGVKKFLTLYFACGVFGGLVQALAGGLAEAYGHSFWALRFAAPTVGASAGALGLVAAFAMLYPERLLTLLLFFIIPVSMRAKFLLLFSAALAVFGILYPVSNMADAAHLGGMLMGVFYIRYAVHWNWRWPQLRPRLRAGPARLVKVNAATSARWARKNGAVENLPPEEFLSREVDPILDKISAQGIQSLTERERRILETARERMAKR